MTRIWTIPKHIKKSSDKNPQKEDEVGQSKRIALDVRKVLTDILVKKEKGNCSECYSKRKHHQLCQLNQSSSKGEIFTLPRIEN